MFLQALAKFIKLFAATAVANHGAAIAAEGLSALNIGACEKASVNSTLVDMCYSKQKLHAPCS